jgi:pyridinium-3,5-biscarboxylic acid mononucleotide synthase
MDEDTLRRLLAAVRARGTSVDQAVRRLKGAPYERLGDMATLDTHRALRVGMPEVVYAEA